jgi:hypothetical protein
MTVSEIGDSRRPEATTAWNLNTYERQTSSSVKRVDSGEMEESDNLMGVEQHIFRRSNLLEFSENAKMEPKSIDDCNSNGHQRQCSIRFYD